MNTHNHLLRNGQAYLFLSLPRHSVLYNNHLSHCLSQILLLPLLNVTFFNSSQILHYFQIINFVQNCWAFMNPEFIFSTAAIIWNTFYPSDYVSFYGQRTSHLFSLLHFIYMKCHVNMDNFQDASMTVSYFKHFALINNSCLLFSLLSTLDMSSSFYNLT